VSRVVLGLNLIAFESVNVPATTVHQSGDELRGAGHGVKHSMHFLLGEHGGQALGSFGADGVNVAFQRLPEYLAVQEKNSVEGLILGGGSDVQVHGQVGEEGLDPSTSSGHRFGHAHVFWMSLAMEENEALDPAHIGFFCAKGVVFPVDDFADLVEEVLGAFL